MGAAAPSRLRRAVRRPARLQHRHVLPGGRRRLADGRSVVVADARRPHPDGQPAARAPRGCAGRRLRRHRRPPPAAAGRPVVDAAVRGGPRRADVRRRDEPQHAARPHVRPRPRRGAHGARVAGDPARPRTAGGVHPGRRPVEHHVQRRAGDRPGARRCAGGRRRAGMGVPGQRGLVLRRRDRVGVVASGPAERPPPGRDPRRCGARRPALRGALTGAAKRAHPHGIVHRAGCRHAGVAADRRARTARPRLRRLRHPPRLLRRRGHRCRHAAPAARRRVHDRPARQPARRA